MTAPDWPKMMKRETAAKYCDMSVNSFLKEIAAGRLPAGVQFGGLLHWHRNALDKALALIAGEADDDEIARELRDRYAA